MKYTIKESKSYDRFMPSGLRASRRIGPLTQSIKEHGFLEMCPIVVAPRNGKFQILDGGGDRRFAAAKALKVPFNYLVVSVSRRELDPRQLHDTIEKLTTADDISRWARVKPEYAHLRKILANCGDLPTWIVIQGLSEETDGLREKFRKGIFSISPDGEDLVSRVLEIRDATVRIFKQANTTGFLGEVLAACRWRPFDDRRFLKNCRAHSHLLKQQATREQYLKMIDAIYNRCSREKIPLEHNVQAAAKERARQRRQALQAAPPVETRRAA